MGLVLLLRIFEDNGCRGIRYEGRLRYGYE